MLLARHRILFFEPRGGYFGIPAVTRDLADRASEHENGRYRPNRCDRYGGSHVLILAGPAIALHGRDREDRHNEADRA